MKSLLFALALSFTTVSFAQGVKFEEQPGELTFSQLAVIENENECKTSDKNRETKIIDASNIKISHKVTHVGVTPDGDIMVLSNASGKMEITLMYCKRPGLTGDYQFMGSLRLDPSAECPIDQITASNVALGISHGGQYILSFAPIHILGTTRKSSLCVGKEEKKVANTTIVKTTTRTTRTINSSGSRVIQD